MTSYDHDGVQVLIGDARDRIRDIPEATVQCVVTSPPYYGLRDYGVDGQIGLEPTMAEFIATLVEVFREVRRVLRPDGTLWLNLGDSYVSPGSGGRDPERWPRQQRNQGSTNATRKDQATDLPLKNMMGVPWRVAFALQDDGWILRQDIVWAKPNPMPESVKDRCTKAHEYIFLFAKSPRYYFDGEAIAEPVADSTVARLQQPSLADQDGSFRVPGRRGIAMKAVPPAGWDTRPGSHSVLDHNRPGSQPTKYRAGEARDYEAKTLRNRRTVWTISPEPSSENHFARFPSKLAELCIAAGSRPGDTVLDPFAGSGTTLHAAYRMERGALGIELNPEYLPLITGPLAQQVLRMETAS